MVLAAPTNSSGTNVSDPDDVDLFAGVDLTTSATGSAVLLRRPGDVSFVLTLDEVTGTTPVLTVTIQGSDAEAFDDDVVTLATLSSVGTTDDDNVRSAPAHVIKNYVRAVNVISGTTPVYTGATLFARQPHWHRTTANSSTGPIV